MKTRSLPALAALIASAAPLLWPAAASAATDYGTIVSSTPVLGQVAVPQRDCYDEQVTHAGRPSGGGALVGGIVGGLIGNAIGHGSGRAAATAIGVVTGAAVGNEADRNSAPRSVSTVRRCQTSQYQEDRIIGYDVVYDYAGTRRSVRLPTDPGGPGTRIALDVNVVPAALPRSSRQGMPVPPPGHRSRVDDGAVGVPAYEDRVESTVYEDTRYVPVPVPAPAYYAPYPYYYGAPAVISIGTHWHGHHHRDWNHRDWRPAPQPVDPVRRRHDPARGRL